MPAFVDQSAKNPVASDVKQAFRRRLLPFSKIAECNLLRVHTWEHSLSISISWHSNTPRHLVSEEETYVDCQIVGGVFFLLHIQLGAQHRGKGLGDLLYRQMEQVASDLGLREIRQTPSGWTGFGETREDYLVRRGWIVDEMELFKTVSG